MIWVAWVSVLMQGYVNSLGSPVATETRTVPEVAVYLNTFII